MATAARLCCTDTCCAAWLHGARSLSARTRSHLAWGNNTGRRSNVTTATAAPAAPIGLEAAKEVHQHVASKHEARKPQKLALKATSPTQLKKADKSSFAAAGVCFYAFKPEDQQLYVLMVHEARRRQFKKAPQPSNLGSVAPAPTSAILPESNMQTELAQEAAPQSQGAGTAVAAGGTAGNGQQGSSAAEAPVSQEQLALHREQDAAAEASTGRPTLVWNFPGGKRKGRELATFTAAREVEEETHRVVTANRTLPMLSYAQCHYIAHCRYNMFLAELPDAWDIPDKVHATVQAGQQHMEAKKVLGAAWVPLDKVSGLLRGTRAARKQGRATTAGVQAGSSGQGQVQPQAVQQGDSGGDEAEAAADSSGQGQLQLQLAQHSTSGDSQDRTTPSSSSSATSAVAGALEGSQAQPSSSSSSSSSSAAAAAMAPLVAPEQEVLAVVACTVLGEALGKWLTSRQERFRQRLRHGESAGSGDEAESACAADSAIASGLASDATPSAGDGDGASEAGSSHPRSRTVDGAESGPDGAPGSTNQRNADAELRGEATAAPARVAREPVLWTSGPDPQPLPTLLPRPVRTVLRAELVTLRVAVSTGAAAVAEGEQGHAEPQQQKGQEGQQRPQPQWRLDQGQQRWGARRQQR